MAFGGMNALSITDLQVFYGEFQALFNISLDVNVGETVAIIGANGVNE